MWRAPSMACKSCHNQNSCSECRAFFQRSVSFKNFESVTISESNTYTRLSDNGSLNDKTSSYCSICDSSNCLSCSTYNTAFNKNA